MGYLSRFDEFHEQAMEATGLDDFGGGDYHDALRRLLKDYDTYPKFSDLGLKMKEGEIVGNLAGRLFEEHGFKSYPSFSTAPVQKPLIITGMPRTGTTVLHRLISHDPGVQSLPLWLALTPQPRPPRETWENNPCYQQAVQAFDQLYEIAPRLKEVHPMIPSEPDECRFSLDHSFLSPGLASVFTLPDYAAWCLHEADARYAYRRYRKVLGLVARNSPKRWLLKDPCHLWCLPALLDTFPDACIVVTHRDPAETIASMASAIYHMTKIFEEVDPAILARTLLKNWSVALDHTENFRSANPSHFFDVHIKETRLDPIGTVERIYRHFDIPITEEAQLAWTTKGLNDPASKHGPHHATPEQFGLTKELIYKQVGKYYDRFLRVKDAIKIQG